MSVDFDFRKKDPYLRRRYGIKNERFPKWLRVATVFFLMAIAWTFWSGLNRAHPEVRYDLISFKPIDAKNIEIHFTVNFKTKTSAHICTLVARDLQANTVGEQTEVFEAGITSQDLVRTISTRVAAVNAGILGCQIR